MNYRLELIKCDIQLKPDTFTTQNYTKNETKFIYKTFRCHRRKRTGFYSVKCTKDLSNELNFADECMRSVLPI